MGFMFIWVLDLILEKSERLLPDNTHSLNCFIIQPQKYENKIIQGNNLSSLYKIISKFRIIQAKKANTSQWLVSQTVS